MNKQNVSTSENATEANSLVAYFSYSGNTEKVAGIIAEEVHGDILNIIPQIAYPLNYDECVAQAKKEAVSCMRPAFRSLDIDIQGYDTIYIGYPCWWYSAPMVIFTFLEHYDFSDKKVRLFTTHGGSGFGHGIEDIAAVLEHAHLDKAGLAIPDRKVDVCRDEVIRWVNRIHV